MADQNKYKETLITSKRAFSGRRISLDADTILRPDGSESTREVVRHPGSVLIVPWIDHETIILVNQYRYATGRLILELPAGTLDVPGETPASCAARELMEETGYRAASLTPLLDFYTSPGISDEYMRCFKATGLTPAPATGDQEEFIDIVLLPFTDALEMIRKGDILDAKTIAALLYSK